MDRPREIRESLVSCRANVTPEQVGLPAVRNRRVGELTLAFEGLDLAAEPGLTRTIHTAEPGSPGDERLRMLGSWAASRSAADTTRPHAGDEPTLHDPRWHESS